MKKPLKGPHSPNHTHHITMMISEGLYEKLYTLARAADRTPSSYMRGLLELANAKTIASPLADNPYETFHRSA